MLAYRIEGIIGESLCKDENDRNAVAEMKHKYANRSEVFNNRFGKNAYIFIIPAILPECKAKRRGICL